MSGFRVPSRGDGAQIVEIPFGTYPPPAGLGDISYLAGSYFLRKRSSGPPLQPGRATVGSGGLILLRTGMW